MGEGAVGTSVTHGELDGQKCLGETTTTTICLQRIKTICSPKQCCFSLSFCSLEIYLFVWWLCEELPKEPMMKNKNINKNEKLNFKKSDKLHFAQCTSGDLVASWWTKTPPSGTGYITIDTLQCNALYTETVSNCLEYFTLRIGHLSFVWYLNDTVSSCFLLSELVMSLSDLLSWLLAFMATIISYCDLSVLSSWLASTLCHWHCHVSWQASESYSETDPDLWLWWATVGVVLSLWWATVGVALSWRPFTELRNIDIDPLSSFIGDYPGSFKSLSTVGVENLLLIIRRILINLFTQQALGISFLFSQKIGLVHI